MEELEKRSQGEQAEGGAQGTGKEAFRRGQLTGVVEWSCGAEPWRTEVHSGRHKLARSKTEEEIRGEQELALAAHKLAGQEPDTTTGALPIARVECYNILGIFANIASETKGDYPPSVQVDSSPLRQWKFLLDQQRHNSSRPRLRQNCNFWILWNVKYIFKYIKTNFSLSGDQRLTIW